MAVEGYLPPRLFGSLFDACSDPGTTPVWLFSLFDAALNNAMSDVPRAPGLPTHRLDKWHLHNLTWMHFLISTI